ncbi:hypothetical protein [Streptomyces asiaticus]|uniref:hypothetical protein n=1 Tax=Streptomyces asiaticus TaxID=114695 RepID=UPI00381A464A
MEMATGVPSWLVPGLQDWLKEFMGDIQSQQRELAVAVQVPVETWDPRKSGTHVAETLTGWFLLDGIDYWLTKLNDIPQRDVITEDEYHHLVWLEEKTEKLDELLKAGRSAYHVNGRTLRLEQRVDSTVRQAVEYAADLSANDAKKHLAHAWNYAYSLNPNPSQAYAECMRAAECAAIPVVVPNNQLGTLNHVRGELRRDIDSDTPKWMTSITVGAGSQGMKTVVSMLDLLIQGQTDRHGGVGPTIPIRQEAAEAAVHLTATLVQWFSSGAIRKTDSFSIQGA